MLIQFRLVIVQNKKKIKGDCKEISSDFYLFAVSFLTSKLFLLVDMHASNLICGAKRGDSTIVSSYNPVRKIINLQLD